MDQIARGVFFIYMSYKEYEMQNNVARCNFDDYNFDEDIIDLLNDASNAFTNVSTSSSLLCA